MRLRYVSDIHLEINIHSMVPNFLVGIEDESIIFDGDTLSAAYLLPNKTDARSRSVKKSFEILLKQVKDFDQVFFTLGNHEHYSGHFQSTKEIIQNFMYKDCGLSEKQYIVLDNNLFFLDKDTILVGATLWTDMRQNNPTAHFAVGRGMNDFRLIQYGPEDDVGIFRTEDAYLEHMKSKDYISAVAHEHPNKRIIVATHHAPSYQSNGRYYNDSAIIDGYCSDLENFIFEHPNITDWIHGHTHVNVEYNIGQCRVTSNMRGYVDYDVVRFDSKTFLEKYIEI